MLTTTQSYAIAYFLPIILRNGMGFNIAASQCLVAPPYLAAGIAMYAEAWFADKYRMRAPVIVVNAIIGLIGLPLLGFTDNNGVRYFGVFLATICANANIPAILTYQANNIRFVSSPLTSPSQKLTTSTEDNGSVPSHPPPSSVSVVSVVSSDPPSSVPRTHQDTFQVSSPVSLPTDSFS